MKAYLKYSWVFLFLIQIFSVLIYFGFSTSNHGLYNRDAFSYDVQWSNVSKTLNPFGEPVLQDPSHDLVRIPFSFPHFLMGLTAKLTSPVSTYLIWCCLGVLTLYFSLVFFARALGFSKEYAYLAALVHYTWFHLLSQVPPLSGNQLQYILDLLMLQPDNILHFGPLQYPHDIFFYPLLYTLLALTLLGVKKIKAGESITIKQGLTWGGLCILFPFNYFYHWFQFAFVLGFIVAVGFMLRWWRFRNIKERYPQLGFIFCFVLAAWGGVIFFQNSQLADEEGYRFALMGGLAEARFFLMPMGLLLRVVLWSAVVLIVLKVKPDTVLLVGFLLGCLLLMNMQLVVGKNIQPGHWSFGVDRIYGWIAILILASAIRKYGQLWLPKLVPATVLITLVFFIAQTILSWKHFEKLSRWDDERTEVIAFLNSQPLSVVLAPELWLERDILVHTPHYSFLPRGAQSAVSHREQMERLTHAALLLGYSKEGFNDWLHIRGVRFFGMLYGTEKEFSSTLYYDKVKQQEVIDYHAKRLLPSWDWEEVNLYLTSDEFLEKKLDWIVLHAGEPSPVEDDIVFQNDRYRVIRASKLDRKSWGSNVPVKEQRYPIVDQSKSF